MKAYREALGKQLVADQAVQWLCELREGDEATQKAFLAWLKESPRHVKEFLVASAMWKELDSVGPQDAAGIDLVVAEALASSSALNVVPLNETARVAAVETDTVRPRPSRAQRWAWSLAAAVVVVALGGWLLYGASAYHTDVGEQRIVRLSDGSVLYLNTESRVRVSYSKDSRDIKLLNGEALFVVAKDSMRPFRVTAGKTVIQAIGTQFNVYRRAYDTKVSVIEGRVKIADKDVVSEPTATADSPDIRSTSPVAAGHAHVSFLGAGEEASIANNGGILKQESPEIAAAVAWRERRLVFRGNTLEEVAAEFNRYLQQPIRIEGERARSKRLAGTFNADDPESLVLFLKEFKDLTVQTDSAGIVVHPR